MTEETPIPDKVAESFRQLKAVAGELNTVSGELGKPIAALDEALKRLNLGVSAWVKIRGGDSEDGENYWLLELGYAKVASSWGIAVRERRGCYTDETERGESWLFDNAPRHFRIEAVDLLPDLLAKLTTDASETTKRLKEKIGKAQQIAAAVGEPRVTARDAARALAASQRK